MAGATAIDLTAFVRSRILNLFVRFVRFVVKHPVSGPQGFQTPHDPRDPRETRRIKVAPRWWSFSMRYLTRQVDVALLSITVIVDTIMVVNGRRCFRSLTDAHIHQAPDRR
jgi:hypothetical protein